jgi:hypothetical protein
MEDEARRPTDEGKEFHIFGVDELNACMPLLMQKFDLTGKIAEPKSELRILVSKNSHFR